MPPPFKTGDLVLLAKPFYERGVGMILPQSDGPYLVDTVHNDHTCTLLDAVSQTPYMQGSAISLARLIRYNYPVEFVGESADDPPNLSFCFDELRSGDFVAVKVQRRVFVGKIARLFFTSKLVQIELWEVDSNERFGPWARRKWVPYLDGAGAQHVDIFHESDLVCVVTLSNQALTEKSLEDLAVLGVPVGVQPTRDKSMPGILL